MNLFDLISYIAIAAIVGVVCKMWSSLDTYFNKKAENLATKQDVTDITTKTEEIQAEFNKTLSEFDADLSFKYDFYEKQYRELYTSLFYLVCESESLRFILNNLSKGKIVFKDIPIVEYYAGNDRKGEETEKSIFKKLLDLISNKYVYASPSLLKMSCALINIREYPMSVDNEDQKKILEHQFRLEIVKIILRDYYWLRKQLHLQESDDELNKVESGEFISIQ